MQRQLTGKSTELSPSPSGMILISLLGEMEFSEHLDAREGLEQLDKIIIVENTSL